MIIFLRGRQNFPKTRLRPRGTFTTPVVRHSIYSMWMVYFSAVGPHSPRIFNPGCFRGAVRAMLKVLTRCVDLIIFEEGCGWPQNARATDSPNPLHFAGRLQVLIAGFGVEAMTFTAKAKVEDTAHVARAGKLRSDDPHSADAIAQGYRASHDAGFAARDVCPL
jgi:hypothetical protein